jgi:hypothetical protein
MHQCTGIMGIGGLKVLSVTILLIPRKSGFGVLPKSITDHLESSKSEVAATKSVPFHASVG